MIEKFVLEGTQVTLLEKLKNKQDLLPKQCLDMPIDELKTVSVRTLDLAEFG